jgi:hypothetical protein
MKKMSKILLICGGVSTSLALITTTSIIAHNSVPTNNFWKYTIVTSTLNGSDSSNWKGWETSPNKLNLNSNYIISTIPCYYSAYSRLVNTTVYYWWETTLSKSTEDYYLDHTGLQIDLLDGTVIHTWD